LELVLDTHAHTVACGHAYSTIKEIAEEAANKGLKLIAITEHGPSMPGTTRPYFFSNIRVVPSNICGVRVLKGIEANIMDSDGRLDLPDNLLARLDIVIASLHDVTIQPGDVEYNTQAMVNAMKNPYVDIIAHPGNPVFAIDIEKVVEAAKQYNVLLEINNHSFTARKGSYDNCLNIARKVKVLNWQVALGSDAHICYDIGNFTDAMDIVTKAEMTEDNVINTSVYKLLNFLKQKGKAVEFID
jgi:putative hydrolase